MVSMQLDHAAEAQVNIQENSGQIAIGKYVVQIGSVHGGVVNIAMPEEQARWQPRLAPVLLRPRRFSGLLDRQVERRAATAAVHTAEPLEFYSPPGWGKTTLLRHLAYDLSTTSCPDGIIYTPANQQPLSDLLQFLFEAFFDSNIPAKPTAAQIRQGLIQKRALILLDDVDIARPDLEALLDFVPHSAFLLASPERRLWSTGEAMPMAGLPPEDGLTLLVRELGRSLTAEEQSVAPTLCTLLNGHPLHLQQAAGLVRDQGQSLAEITRRLQHGSPQESLAAQLLATLAAPERQIVALLAALGGAPLSLEHVAGLAGLPEPAPVLESLQQRHVIQSHSPRYSLTGVLAQNWPSTWDLTLVSERLLAYFTGWAEQQSSPGRLLAEVDTLGHLLAEAVKSARWPEVLRLVRALDGPLSLGRRWGMWVEVLQSGLQAAEGLGDRAAKAWVWHQLGTRALGLEETAVARSALARALRLRETLGDYAGAAVTRHNLTLLLGPPPPQSPPKPSAPSGLATVTTGTLWLLLGAAGLLFVLLMAVAVWPGPALLSSFLGPPVGGQRGQPETPTAASQLLPGPTVTFTPGFTATSTVPPATATPTPPAPTRTPPPTSTATATALPTATSTATHTATPTPTFTPTPTATFTSTPTVTPVPVAYLVPEDLSFGSLRVGETSRTETVTLTNIGGGSLRVTNIFLEGEHPNDYLFNAGNCQVSAGLLAGRGCTLAVRFRPTSGGNRQASLAIFTNSLDSPRTVFLTGDGLADPAVSLSPDALDFGEQPVGSAGERRPVLVANTGQGNLIVDRIDVSGAHPADFTFEENCTGLVLRPGDSCLISLQFIPGAAELRTAELILIDNAPGNQQLIPLRGTGQAAQPDLVIIDMAWSGPGRINQKGEIEVPLHLVVKNEGNAEAGLFKVSTEYTGADGTFGLPFTVPGQNNMWYPFTGAPLPAGGEAVFDGIVTFSARLQGQGISLAALADSCSGDEFMPAYCRVEESREDNNLAEGLSMTLPAGPGVIR